MAESLKRATVQFLLKYCGSDLEQVVRSPNDEDHFGVPVDFVQLADADLVISQALFAAPRDVFNLLDDSAMEAQHFLIDALQGANDTDDMGLVAKAKVHVRVHGMPFTCQPGCSALSPSVGELGSQHINRLVSILGTVVRCGAVKMFESHQEFECTRCHTRFWLKCSLENGGAVTLPGGCPRSDKPCAGSNFRKLVESQSFTSYQELRIQEKSQSLAMGSLPCSLTVVVQDELADAVHPGDDVETLGVIVPRWEAMVPGQRCSAELVLLASNLTRVSKQKHESATEIPPELAAQFEEFWQLQQDYPIRGRNKILAAMCPQIFGLFLVKLVGKSQVMRFASRVSPRSVVTTGKASSGAGLTCTAVKDGDTWVLEAGALVLADGGLCCIDEFDGIKEEDRAMMHEAMEQQTVHVAKAGIVTTLSTRATVLGACNPKASWRPSKPISEATNISSPLLSRFDIVLVLSDTRNAEWDRIISHHVLSNHQMGEVQDPSKEGSTEAGSAFRQARQAVQQQASSQGWTIEVMQMYLVWCKAKFQPIMTDPAEELIVAYYQKIFQWEMGSTAVHVMTHCKEEDPKGPQGYGGAF
eukprot:gene25579-11230_t